MSPTIPHNEPGAPYEAPGIPDRFQNIRSTVREMDPDAVARQLPKLVELIADHSADDVPTIRFVVGVSFSQNETLFDYRLERLVPSDDSERPLLETIKPAVNSDHFYLLFAYPPDPYFDASALRGALLGAIEDQIAVLSSSDGPHEADSLPVDEADEGSTLISRLRAQLH